MPWQSGWSGGAPTISNAEMGSLGQKNPVEDTNVQSVIFNTELFALNSEIVEKLMEKAVD